MKNEKKINRPLGRILACWPATTGPWGPLRPRPSLVPWAGFFPEHGQAPTMSARPWCHGVAGSEVASQGHRDDEGETAPPFAITRGELTWGGRRRRVSSPVMGWRLPTWVATWWGPVGRRWRKFVEEERGPGLVGGVMPRNRGGESSSWPRKWRWWRGGGGLILVRGGDREVLEEGDGSLAWTAPNGAMTETRAAEVTLAVGERKANPWAWLPDRVNSQLLNKF
jgi:hypothetical protein